MRRALTGDFERLFRLLAATDEALTPRRLDELGIDEQGVARAAQRIATLRLPGGDDACAVVFALWARRAGEFVDISSRWRGRKGPLARFIQAVQNRGGSPHG